jgi:hypothetical protein
MIELTSQLVATALTIVILIFICCMQFVIRHNVAKAIKSYQSAIDHLYSSTRKMGVGWMEVAQAIDEMQRRIDIQEQRILNLEGRKWTVHHGGRREGSDDPTGGDAA